MATSFGAAGSLIALRYGLLLGEDIFLGAVFTRQYAMEFGASGGVAVNIDHPIPCSGCGRPRECRTDCLGPTNLDIGAGCVECLKAFQFCRTEEGKS